MNDGITGIVGGVGCILTAGMAEEVSAIVGIVCTSAIALVTCGVQLYRLIRDRDSDKETKKNDGRKDGNE